MPLHGFSLRFKALALWLSLLALCSALMAPASALSQEMRTGKWTGLCSAGMAMGQDGQAHDEGTHCNLCTLPGLVMALPEAAGLQRGQVGSVRVPARPIHHGAWTAQRPAIRGPPWMS